MLLRPLSFACVACLALACGDEVTPASPAAGGSEPAGCDEDEVRDATGSCLRPGVPADACGDGFAHDGGGCEPVLPADPCPRGTMAVVGDTQCQPVADCGEGPWGNIPVGPDTEYVDASFAGVSDGSADAPWTNINIAVNAAGLDAVVAIAAGSYETQFNITKPIAIWGRCPELVEIVGDTANAGAVLVSTDRVELHQLAITGAGMAMSIQDAADVVLDRLWLHDTPIRAFQIQTAGQPTSATLSRSLIEDVAGGPIVFGSELTVIDSEFRANPGFAGERGLTSQVGSAGEWSALTVEGSVFHGHIEGGVSAFATDLEISRTVLRDIFPRPDDGEAGVGVLIGNDGTHSANGTVRQCYFERTSRAGVNVQGAEALIETSTFRNIQPDVDLRGSAVAVVTRPVDSHATVRQSWIEGTTNSAIFNYGATVEIEATVVRDVQRSALDRVEASGALLQVAFADWPTTPQMRVSNSIVEGAVGVGIGIVGGELLLERSTIRDGVPTADVLFGHAVHMQGGSPHPTSLVLRDTRLERNHSHGALINGAAATIENAVIVDTRAIDGIFGDGLAVVSDTGIASLEVSASLIEGSERAGVANFGAAVALAQTSLDCNAIQLASQPHDGAAASFDDAGENVCGCGAETQTCKVVTADLQPPGEVQATGP
jgi:hypothetical protein